MKKLAALLLAVCMLLCGCGSRSEKPYVPTGDALVSDDDTGPTEAPKTEPQELTLTYYPDRPINPLTCTDYTNRALISLIYQSLFAVNRNYQVEPQLCSKYSISEDMKTYTFYLEKATFSDGTPLTVQDVLASLQAAKESQYYGGRFTHVSAMEVIEGNGLQITLDTPYENLPILLDIPIVKDSDVLLEWPVGTGPYVLNRPSSRLERRQDWWCKSDMVVTADSIPLIQAESTTQIRDNFQFSDLDLVCADPGSDKYADYRCDYELWDCENGMFLYLACNMSNELFQNTDLRSALTFAIDRDMLVDTYYRGFARSATLPASPLSPYYNQNLASHYEYDPEKFSQAVVKAGLVGREVRLLVNSDDSLRVRVAKEIARMLNDGGLKVTVTELSTTYYLNALYYRDFDMYLGQTKLSPNMDLSQFFYLYGSLSYGSINNTSVHELCLEALANHGNYYTLHQTVMDGGYICPILFRSYAVYATRGLLTRLTPARDNVFYYSLGKNMTQALIQPPEIPETSEPEEE